MQCDAAAAAAAARIAIGSSNYSGGNGNGSAGGGGGGGNWKTGGGVDGDVGVDASDHLRSALSRVTHMQTARQRRSDAAAAAAAEMEARPKWRRMLASQTNEIEVRIDLKMMNAHTHLQIHWLQMIDAHTCESMHTHITSPLTSFSLSLPA
jgi:hypothetical protein